jgi:PIN domain nuclease of toxin-antitoxin system
VKLLFDTHAYLWFAAGDRRLSVRARRRIEDPKNERCLSIASVWELAIKISLGKLRLTVPLGEHLERGLRDAAAVLLPIAREHAVAVATLPPHHADPFDRLLIAQALAEDMVVVGADETFDAYGVRRAW